MLEVIDTTRLYSQEAEEAVIASILISPDQFIGLQGFLRAGDFFLIRHRILWQSFERLSDKGEPIAAYTVGMDLAAMGQIEDVGGPIGIMAFLSIDVNSLYAETFARLVQRCATRRAMLEAADELRKNAYDESASIDMVIARAEQTALSLRRRQMAVDTPQLTMEQAMIAKFDAMRESETRYKDNPHYVIGVRTGVTDLDKMLDGLRPGVTTLAASTGMGKTAMALQMIRYAAQFGLLRGVASLPAKTLFFSGEMTQDQMMNRLLGSMTGVPIRHIERGSYTSAQRQLLIEAMHNLTQEHTLSFESGKRMNTAQIRQRVRTLVLDNELDFLALDGLLQIEALSVSDSDSPKQKAFMNDKRRDVIETIMNDLEDITLTYNTPILLTHQLSRAPGGRSDKRPILSDLAEANFVEQKSAVILFLFRESYYDANSMNPNGAEIICAKNRHGQVGTVHQIFNGQFTRFEDADIQRIELGR
jgi:replicative DNA helicase